jgi:hypothetical protein
LDKLEEDERRLSELLNAEASESCPDYSEELALVYEFAKNPEGFSDKARLLLLTFLRDR